MTPFAEQGGHLRLGYGAGNEEFRHAAVQRVQATAEPYAGRLTLLLVVGRERPVAAVRVVPSSHLPRQVRVPVAGRELVQAHHGPTVTRPYATQWLDDLVKPGTRARNAPGVTILRMSDGAGT